MWCPLITALEKVEAGVLSLRTGLVLKAVGQLGIHSETLSQTTEKTEEAQEEYSMVKQRTQ